MCSRTCKEPPSPSRGWLIESMSEQQPSAPAHQRPQRLGEHGPQWVHLILLHCKISHSPSSRAAYVASLYWSCAPSDSYHDRQAERGARNAKITINTMKIQFFRAEMSHFPRRMAMGCNMERTCRYCSSTILLPSLQNSVRGSRCKNR